MKPCLGSLVLLLLTPGLGLAQEPPELTPDRAKMVTELLKACAERKAVTRNTDPQTARANPWIIDRARLKTLLEQRRKTLTTQMDDALVAVWPRTTPDAQLLIADLLEEIGKLRQDARPTGLGLFLTGVVHDREGQNEKALAAYKKALTPLRQAKASDWEVRCLENLAAVHDRLANFDEAQDHLRQVLALYRQIYPAERHPNGHHQQALALNNLGFLLHTHGEHEAALRLLREAVALYRRLYPANREPGGHDDLASALANLGRVHQARGEHALALDCFEQAREMTRKLYPRLKFLSGHPHVAACQDLVAGALHHLGADSPALIEARQALRMRESCFKGEPANGLHPDLASSHEHLGELLLARGNAAEAAASFRTALGLWRRLHPLENDPRVIGCLRHLGRATLAHEGGRQAAVWQRLAVGLAEKAHPKAGPDRGHALNDLAGSLALTGEKQSAVETYRAALQALRLTEKEVDLERAEASLSLPARPDAVLVASNLAVAQVRLAGPEAKIEDLRAAERAFALAETLRDWVRVAPRPEDRLLFAEAPEGPAAGHLGILHRLFSKEGKVEHLRTAFAVLERHRAVVLRRGLDIDRAIRATGVSEADSKRHAVLSRELALLEARFLRLTNQNLPIKPELLKARADVRDKLSALEARLARENPGFAALACVGVCTLAEAREELSASEVALVFVLGETESYVLAIQPKSEGRDEGLTLAALPGRQTIADLADLLGDPQMLRREARTRWAGRRAFEQILGPIAEQIKGKDLVIVADGLLNLLPFEVLVDGEGKFLGERKVRRLPSLTSARHLRLAGQKRKPAESPFFALGDPVYRGDDARARGQAAPGTRTRLAVLSLLSRQGETGFALERLGSGDELTALGKLLGAEKDAVLTGLAATESALKKASAAGALARHRRLHLATRGVLGQDHGQPPALIFSLFGTTDAEDTLGADDGCLSLPEVAGLRLNADVVVLPATRFARGSLRDGEGLPGLTRAFLSAGSHGVVCSLWDDEGADSSRMVLNLYEGLQKGQKTADALLAARRSLIQQGAAPLVWARLTHVGQ